MRQVGQRFDFLTGVECAEFRRLTDTDGFRLRMVLEAEAVQTCLHQLGRQLAVGRVDSEESTSHHPLRGTAFVDIDMCRLGAHHGLVRAAHGVDTQHIGTRTVKHQIHTCLWTENVLEQLLQPLRVFIVAVCQRMLAVGLCYGLYHFGTHARMVVATETSFHLSVSCI